MLASVVYGATAALAFAGFAVSDGAAALRTWFLGEAVLMTLHASTALCAVFVPCPAIDAADGYRQINSDETDDSDSEADGDGEANNSEANGDGAGGNAMVVASTIGASVALQCIDAALGIAAIATAGSVPAAAARYAVVALTFAVLAAAATIFAGFVVVAPN